MSRLGGFLRSPVQVLVAGLVLAALLSMVWAARATTGAAAVPVPVPAHGTGTAGGATWRLDGLGVVDSLPSGATVQEPVPGAVFVVGKFTYESASAQELHCSVRLAGDRREWSTVFFTPVDPDSSAGCDGRPGGTAEVAFQVPRAAVGEIRGIEIAAGDGAVLLQGRLQ